MAWPNWTGLMMKSCSVIFTNPNMGNDGIVVWGCSQPKIVNLPTTNGPGYIYIFTYVCMYVYIWDSDGERERDIYIHMANNWQMLVVWNTNQWGILNHIPSPKVVVYLWYTATVLGSVGELWVANFNEVLAAFVVLKFLEMKPLSTIGCRYPHSFARIWLNMLELTCLNPEWFTMANMGLAFLSPCIWSNFNSSKGG